MGRRHRLAFLVGERGFSVVELVTLLVALGILSTAAVSSYAWMRQRESDATARLNLAAAVEASHAYRTGQGSFTGLTLHRLRAIDSSIPRSGVSVVYARARTVCLGSTVSRRTWYRVYPGGTFTRTRCG